MCDNNNTTRRRKRGRRSCGVCITAYLSLATQLFCDCNAQIVYRGSANGNEVDVSPWLLLCDGDLEAMGTILSAYPVEDAQCPPKGEKIKVEAGESDPNSCYAVDVDVIRDAFRDIIGDELSGCGWGCYEYGADDLMKFYAVITSYPCATNPYAVPGKVTVPTEGLWHRMSKMPPRKLFTACEGALRSAVSVALNAPVAIDDTCGNASDMGPEWAANGWDEEEYKAAAKKAAGTVTAGSSKGSKSTSVRTIGSGGEEEGWSLWWYLIGAILAAFSGSKVIGELRRRRSQRLRKIGQQGVEAVAYSTIPDNKRGSGAGGYGSSGDTIMV